MSSNKEKIFFKDKYSMTLEENIFVVERNLVDYIWKSANLEGITVTFPQTQTIVDDGIAVQGMRINEINAIVNLKHAWYFTLENIDYPIDFKFISQINKIIGDYNLIPHSGEIRNTDVSMGGTTWKPKLPNKEEIEEQINIINRIENIIDRAMTMMLYLMRTQPFYDGNKRTAMIVANQIMVQNGKGIISIPLEEQTTFREMLINFYETNDMEKIKKFIYNNCIDGINFEKETSE
ncbi:MAG: Fic family protein [Streptobacillus sp.]